MCALNGEGGMIILPFQYVQSLTKQMLVLICCQVPDECWLQKLYKGNLPFNASPTVCNCI